MQTSHHTDQYVTIDSNEIVHFYDFDETITPKHTYKEQGLTYGYEYDNAFLLESMNRGYAYAQTSLKEGLREHCKHDDEKFSAAIITYHNNPWFIAGYMAHVLNTPLETLQCMGPQAKAAAFAVFGFQITGLNKPLLITCRTEDVLDERKGKNDMILLTKKVLEEGQYVSKNAQYSFFDDDYQNVHTAWKHLSFLNCHQVYNGASFRPQPGHNPRDSLGKECIPDWKTLLNSSAALAGQSLLRNTAGETDTGYRPPAHFPCPF